MLGILLAAQIAAHPSIRTWDGTYSVLDVGKPGVPHLSSRQQAWLGLIRRSPGYAARWKYLRFTVRLITVNGTQGGRLLPLKVPLVVFYARGWTPAFAHYDAPFHIIGEPCRFDFDPVTDGATADVIEACAKDGGWPTPPPILGERRFLASPAPTSSP